MIGLLIGCSEPPACRVNPAFIDADRGNGSCIIRDGDKLLAVVHRFSGRLDLPGGRAQSPESAQCTAHRETWEETGIDVTVGRLLAFKNSTRIYACSSDRIDATTASISAWSKLEVTDLKWVEPATQADDDWRFDQQLDTIKAAMEQ